MKPLTVFVHQWSNPERETLPHVCCGQQVAQVMDFVRRRIAGEQPGHLVTTSEIHVLRLLRLIREEVDGIRLEPYELVFMFDVQDKPGEFVEALPTTDGDLQQKVPGNFFWQRGTELF